jgi:hypothetical protein
MPRPNPERMCAQIDGDFVVFLIGMRINSWWRVRQWLPVARAMPRMLEELAKRPELGLLGHEQWFSRRVALVLQYWRSLDHLMAYAHARDAEHLPAWRAFNRRVKTTSAVGIWHETYMVPAGNYEALYHHMPAFGLGRAAALAPASGARRTAAGRLGRPAPDAAEAEVA